MFEIADQIRGWMAQGRPVTLVRAVRTRGISSKDRAGVAAWTPGSPPVGALLAGAADAQLPALGSSRRLVDIRIEDDAAAVAGLSCGGTAQVLVQPATDLPERTWTLLAEHQPFALVTPLRPALGETELVAAAGMDTISRELRRGTSDAVVVEDGDRELLAVAHWPVPVLVVVGDGLIADALAANAALLGWTFEGTPASAAARAATLTAADAIVVLSHDLEVSGASLAAALTASTGYVGALGSRHTQRARTEWLAAHAVAAADLARIHGPAGLDIGSNTPAEIAVAIVAEALAVRAGRVGGSLRDRG